MADRGFGRLKLGIVHRGELGGSARPEGGMVRRFEPREERLGVKRRSKGTPDRRRRGTPFSGNMMLVC
jgi:hypothetical protein